MSFTFICQGIPPPVNVSVPAPLETAGATTLVVALRLPVILSPAELNNPL